MKQTHSEASRLLGAIETRLDDHYELLQRLASIPSHASTPGGTDKVAGLIVPMLESLGFSINTLEQAPVADELTWTEPILMPGQHQEELGRTYVATRDPGGSLRVLLLGDLDTSYPLLAHENFPVRTEGGRFYGPGVADMKGGLVVLVAALQALDDLGISGPGLDLVLAADEQAGSLGSRHVIRELASGAQWTLCVECARRGGMLMDARGHIGFGDLTARGVESHAGSAYSEGVNATDFLARVIPPVNALSRPEDGVLVTVTILQAGRRRSVIPDHAWGVLDIRTPSEADWNRAIEEIDGVVAEFGEGRVEVRTYAHRPGVLRSSESLRLLELIRRQGDDIGVEIDAFGSAAAGSTAFAAEGGSIVMDGMGPEGGGLMTTDEHIELSSVAPRAAILGATISALAEVG